MAATFRPPRSGSCMLVYGEGEMTTDDRWAWVAVMVAPGIGWDSRRYHDLLRVGPPAELFRASRRALAEAVGYDLAGKLHAFDAAGASAAQRAAAEQSGARLVTLADPEYPASLKP